MSLTFNWMLNFWKKSPRALPCTQLLKASRPRLFYNSSYRTFLAKKKQKNIKISIFFCIFGKRRLEISSPNFEKHQVCQFISFFVFYHTTYQMKTKKLGIFLSRRLFSKKGEIGVYDSTNPLWPLNLPYLFI